MATDHRPSKRPYQPSIASFFARSDSAEACQGSAPRSRYNLSSSSVPSAIQSSLLNVGLRVRKSLADGYKTKQAHPLSPGSTRYDARIRSSRPAELTPYCGILDTGGHHSHSPNYTTNSLDATPSSSQETSTTVVEDYSDLATHPPGNQHKRPRAEDEADEERHNIGDATAYSIFMDDLEPVSPRSYPVSHTSMPDLNRIRPMAHPKTRRKSRFPNVESGVDFTDQENLGPPSRRMDTDPDFEEAAFLRPYEVLGNEVEMSGL
ncbi:MAG: hypothetical protein M1833_001986 [Piccolia ochrophora]|nr:MAG: hypothetical protein M1833_001986 [Piccolia ochrophora]